MATAAEKKAAAEEKKAAKAAAKAAKDSAEVPPRLKSENKDEDSIESKPEPEKDYLKKYEVHVPSGYPYFMVPGVKYSAPAVGSKAETMKKILLAQPRIRFFIQRGQNESPKVLQTVNLNGYRLDLPKNAYMDLPEQVCNVLMDSLKQTESALNQFRIDREGFDDSALR